MPRFYFNIRSPDGLVTDDEGSEFDTVEEARVEAEEGAREMLAAALKAGQVVDGQRFEVMNERGSIVFTYPLRDALKLA